MKKTNLKERLSNALDAFWADGENSSDKFELVFTGETYLLKEEKPSSREKFRKIFGFAKQVLLFLPGTFFTFYLWLGMMLFGSPSGRKPLLFILILLLPPIGMVMGLGEVKKLKDWVMPLSVITLAVLIGILINLVPGLSQFIRNFDNAILLFPLALITAVLSKNIVDSFSEETAN